MQRLPRQLRSFRCFDLADIVARRVPPQNRSATCADATKATDLGSQSESPPSSPSPLGTWRDKPVHRRRRVGITVRTGDGVLRHLEDADPDGLNPQLGEVQVCWSNGAVENVRQSELLLVDRVVRPGELVVPNRWLPTDSGPVQSLSSEIYGGLADWDTVPSVSEDSSESPWLHPDLRRCMRSQVANLSRGVVLSARQVLSIRLFAAGSCSDLSALESLASTSATILPEHETPDENPDLVHDPVSGTYRLDNVAFSPRHQEENAPFHSDFRVVEGVPIEHEGWLGIVGPTMVKHDIRLDGGAAFSFTSDNSENAPTPHIVRSDPSQAIVFVEDCGFFPSQRVLVSSRYIDFFRCQIAELGNTPEIQADEAKKLAVEKWVEEVSSVKRMSRGVVAAVNVVEADVDWLCPLDASCRTPPDRVLGSKDLAQDRVDYVRLGQPIKLNPEVRVRAKDGTLVSLGDIFAKLEMDNSTATPVELGLLNIALVDSVTTYCTVMWDNGRIEVDVPGTALASIEYVLSLPIHLELCDRTRRIPFKMSEKASLVKHLIDGSVIHPHSIVKLVDSEAVLPSEPAQGKAALGKVAAPTSPPFENFKPKQLQHRPVQRRIPGGSAGLAQLFSGRVPVVTQIPERYDARPQIETPARNQTEDPAARRGDLPSLQPASPTASQQPIPPPPPHPSPAAGVPPVERPFMLDPHRAQNRNTNRRVTLPAIEYAGYYCCNCGGYTRPPCLPRPPAGSPELLHAVGSCTCGSAQRIYSELLGVPQVQGGGFQPSDSPAQALAAQNGDTPSTSGTTIRQCGGCVNCFDGGRSSFWPPHVPLVHLNLEQKEEKTDALTPVRLRTEQADKRGLVLSVRRDKGEALVGWIRDIQAFKAYKRAVRAKRIKRCNTLRARVPARLASALDASLLDDMIKAICPFTFEVGVCICTAEERLKCPAWIHNTQLAPPENEDKWLEELSTSFCLPEYANFLQLERRPIPTLVKDSTWGASPGEVFMPDGLLACEARGSGKGLTSSAQCGSALASIGGSTWVRMRCGQVLEFLDDEGAGINIDCCILQMGVVEAWRETEENMSSGSSELSSNNDDDEDDYEDMSEDQSVDDEEGDAERGISSPGRRLRSDRSEENQYSSADDTASDGESSTSTSSTFADTPNRRWRGG